MMMFNKKDFPVGSLIISRRHDRKTYIIVGYKQNPLGVKLFCISEDRLRKCWTHADAMNSYDIYPPSKK
tara:strand:- start:2205 stop:2411 length:207 start_codon:yes stop_codon:yes gene_type:complete